MVGVVCQPIAVPGVNKVSLLSYQLRQRAENDTRAPSMGGQGCGRPRGRIAEWVVFGPLRGSAHLGLTRAVAILKPLPTPF